MQEKVEDMSSVYSYEYQYDTRTCTEIHMIALVALYDYIPYIPTSSPPLLRRTEAVRYM